MNFRMIYGRMIARKTLCFSQTSSLYSTIENTLYCSSRSMRENLKMLAILKICTFVALNLVLYDALARSFFLFWCWLKPIFLSSNVHTKSMRSCEHTVPVQSLSAAWKKRKGYSFAYAGVVGLGVCMENNFGMFCCHCIKDHKYYPWNIRIFMWCRLLLPCVCASFGC